MYRLFGSELSPYSVKVRSYLRYKGIPHEWIPRSAKTQAEFQKYAKLPLIPLLVTPQDEAMQDSTPIIERLETLHPDPPLQPSDPVLAFLSVLIEEYADEWLNKPMFHYRWSYEADQRATADRIAAQMLGDVPEAERTKASEAVRQRMVGRLSLVGSNPGTAPVIEASFLRVLDIVEAHLASRPNLFGGRPCLADFGLWGQLYETSIDPTAGAIIRGNYPNVAAWVARMLQPKATGDFESRETLLPGLHRLLRDEVAGIFLPWSTANAAALRDGSKTVSLPLGGRDFAQEPQKYHARSLGVLRQKRAALAGNTALTDILEATGCQTFLA